MLKKEELQEKVNRYFDIHYPSYQKEIFDYDLDRYVTIEYFIKKYIYSTYIEAMGDENLIFEILSAIKAWDEDMDPYNLVVKDIEKKYGLDKHIIDLCSGIYPNIAVKIDEIQRAKGLNGIVTACDINLIKTKIGNVNLCRKNIKMSLDLTEKDLVISRMPDGEILSDIIESSNQNSIEYYIILGQQMYKKIPDWFIKKEGLEAKDLYNSDVRSILWKKYIEYITHKNLPNNFDIIHEVIYNPITKNNDKIIRTKKR